MTAAEELPSLVDVQDSLNTTRQLLEALGMAIQAASLEPNEKEGLSALGYLIQGRVAEAEKLVDAILDAKDRPRIADAQYRAE